MAEVLLFHHAQGLTPGIRVFAEELRAAGHIVHTPDLSCIPISGEWAFGPWPDGVPVQVHGMDADPFFVDEGDIEAAREIVDTVENAELFLYPGDQHCFADSSLPSSDAEATVLLTGRVLEFLDRV